jgi:hypothetical protein
LLVNRRPERGSLSLEVYDFIAKIYPESDSVYDLPAIDIGLLLGR